MGVLCVLIDQRFAMIWENNLGFHKIAITEEQYAHLPTAIHKMVVDVLLQKGEWVLIQDPKSLSRRV